MSLPLEKRRREDVEEEEEEEEREPTREYALCMLAGGVSFFLKAVGLGLFLLLMNRACWVH